MCNDSIRPDEVAILVPRTLAYIRQVNDAVAVKQVQSDLSQIAFRPQISHGALPARERRILLCCLAVALRGLWLLGMVPSFQRRSPGLQTGGGRRGSARCRSLGVVPWLSSGSFLF